MRHMIRLRSSNLSVFSILRRTHVNSTCSDILAKPITAALLKFSPSTRYSFSAMEPRLQFFSSSSICPSSNHSTSIETQEDANSDDDDGDCSGEEYEEDETEFKPLPLGDEGLVRDTMTIVDILRELGSSPSESKNKLEHCGITASSELVVAVLSQVRNDWEAAFTFFLWAGKQPGYAHSVREYHSMISILGKMRKFGTAWALIDEMRGGTNGPSLVTPQTLLIMIRRYCAVHDVGRAINTFYAYKRFKFEVRIDEFQGFLSALCRYKNVQEAEHLLFTNKNMFPFDTKSFNIILNGWCNVIVSPREGERIWREMSKRGIQHDVISYGCLISCYSKACNLKKVLQLFNQMKEMKIVMDRKVYNAVIHALAKGRLVKEAINLLKTMEEKGVAPNVVTYNSLIKPLCRAQKIEEAKEFFDEMLQRGFSPTIRTYHAFFRCLRTGEEVFVLLEKMKNMGCQPNSDTYMMLIRKFCRWRQVDNAFKLWNTMSKNGVHPDRSSYIVLVHGLFLNGKLEEAHKYYIEMKEKQFEPEPKTDEMIRAWMSGKHVPECQKNDLEGNQLNCRESVKNTGFISKRFDQARNFCRQPETRRVARERGFSFWEQ
ncbi:pentatricopeptide repeat-containing protein At5g15010, mitochondrial isoform X1 [Juglans microcarpa x Juglans regia]|uniref:pentatricopeptide repeat-containing protein At5g15010, mitochondrial isoform X1 n=1 Tax=Juglans microcarpa x Juglans regia TaxID=2249226 RepID=UPI001B7D9470|nr:pentatricopeptide repeat-containing protein At5g15010, mitochondrial isoform X1 [Juglans microcarpa x Juglans regia]XP_040996846.1 pentatricopeptide repeat-containing protein At5g15010, mitochondrial isoform X1 [Juglans microcarpa x Juglans regia]